MKRLIPIFLFIFTLNYASAQIPVHESFDEFESAYLDKNSDNDTTYVLNFWATWCRPCVAELPIFDSFYRITQDQKVKLILVSLDQVDRKVNPVAKFVERTNLESDVVVLTDANYNTWIDKIDTNWSGSIPYTLIFCKDTFGKHEKQYHSLTELMSDVEAVRESTIKAKE